MASLERNKSFNSKSVKRPVFFSPQMSKRTTIQIPNFLKELEANETFVNQREKLGYADKRKSMSLGDLPLKEIGFFEKLTSKLSKSKSVLVKNVDQNNLVQKYRNKEPKEKEFEKYQQERVDSRSPTPKFPVVPEVQLRKSNSLKPHRGSSRSNTIHIVHTNPDHTQKDILISGPLKLTWLNTGLIEIIERGAVVYRNGMLEIRYDANKPKIQMKMHSAMKNNKVWEFYNPDQNIRVSVDRQHQITMGSPRERRKSVEEESPKNINKQNILIKLLRRRSDKQLLERKGIFKNEDIFGNKLSGLYESSKSEIPEFVRRAVELIETDKNIKSEHIYRLSGNMATIQKIRLKIDGRNYKVLDEYKNDVDVLTGCLKLFFRELVEPLIPFKAFEELHKLAVKPPSSDRDKSVKASVKNMKTPHRENLQFLIHHLLIVESYKQHNKMTIQSLSIVWGPSMLWYPGVEKCPNYTPYEFSILVNGVLELILTTYQADPDFDSSFQTLSKNDSRGVSWKELDTISEENSKKSPSIGSTSSKWFGLRKSDSRDKLTASNWSLGETKKDKSSDGYFGKSLESLPKSEMHHNVPKIIAQLTELIEKNPKVKGLYFKPASKDALGKFKKKLQKSKQDLSKMDPLDAAVVLPRFLQDLETPLFPTYIYNDFLDYFDELDNSQQMRLIREGIESLSQERQDTIEYLVMHILRILDCQDEEGKDHILNVWLSVFSNSSVITIENDTFLRIILNMYELKRNAVKELPSFSLPLKSHFEHRFNFKNDHGIVKTTYVRISDSSINESDIEDAEMYSRSNSTTLVNDHEATPREIYKGSLSVDETRKSADLLGENIRDDLSALLNARGKRNNTDLMVKIYNPYIDTASNDITSTTVTLKVNNPVDKNGEKATMSTFKNVDNTQQNPDNSPRKSVDSIMKDIRNSKIDDTPLKRSSIEKMSIDNKNDPKRDVDKPSSTSVFKNFNFGNLKRKNDKNVASINEKLTSDIDKRDIKSNITIIHDVQKDVDRPPLSTFRNVNVTGPNANANKTNINDSSMDTKSSGNVNVTSDIGDTKKIVDKPPTSPFKKFTFGNFKKNTDKNEQSVNKNVDRTKPINKINISNPVLVNTTNDTDIIDIASKRSSIDKSKMSESLSLDSNRRNIDSTTATAKRPSIDKSKINVSPIPDRKDADATNTTSKWPSIERIKTGGSPVLDNMRKNVDTNTRRPSLDKITNSPTLGDTRKNIDTNTRRPSLDKNKIANSPILGNTRKNIDVNTRRPSLDKNKITNSPILGNTRKNVDTNTRRPSLDKNKITSSPILGNTRKNIDVNTRRPSLDKNKITSSPILGNTRKNIDVNTRRPSLDKNKITNSPILGNTRKNVDTNTRRPSVDKNKITSSPILGNMRKNIDLSKDDLNIKVESSVDITKNIDATALNVKTNKNVDKDEVTSKSNPAETENTKRDLNKMGLGLRSNLSKIVAGQTLENARARAEFMTQKKT